MSSHQARPVGPGPCPHSGRAPAQGHPPRAGWRPSHHERLGTGLGRSPKLPAACAVWVGWGPRSSPVSPPVGWGAPACPPSVASPQGLSWGLLLSRLFLLQQWVPGAPWVRGVWTCSAGRKRGSLGRSGSPCRARPASAQPTSTCGLSVSSPCLDTHAPPAGWPTRTILPRGRGTRRPEHRPPGLSAPQGAPPDQTAAAVRSLGTGCVVPGWAGRWDPDSKPLPRGCPQRCPRLGGSMAGGCGLALRGLEVRDLRGSSRGRTGRVVWVSFASGAGGRPLVWGSLPHLYEACASLHPDSPLWKYGHQSRQVRSRAVMSAKTPHSNEAPSSGPRA